ncbi:hypothetical protein HUN01_32575 [Nostoc edaphicum CCNP1411]|uniref:Uncharacterized protein n=1 Tax=Nostoc edaphicum CCNP1411 TaxID=1472755 RepID=A0A7D7R9M6_9NOSO|nr:hypothetical protein [Nostoc edaphicum]QMS92106.1 hypothetical protein HUN01_32575 [Nostoc edaphicum CCNP1411]
MMEKGDRCLEYSEFRRCLRRATPTRLEMMGKANYTGLAIAPLDVAIAYI